MGEGAFQRRVGGPEWVEEEAQTGADNCLHSLLHSFHHLVPNTAGDAGTAAVPTVQLGETDKSKDNCKAKESERRESHAVGIWAPSLLGKELPREAGAGAKASRQRQDRGGGMGTGTGMHLQRWRRAVTQQSWAGNLLDRREWEPRGCGPALGRACPLSPGWVALGQPHSGLSFPSAPQGKKAETLSSADKSSASPTTTL